MFLLVKLLSSLQKVFWTLPRLGQPLRNIYVTNNYGYIPIVEKVQPMKSHK